MLAEMSVAISPYREPQKAPNKKPAKTFRIEMGNKKIGLITKMPSSKKGPQRLELNELSQPCKRLVALCELLLTYSQKLIIRLIHRPKTV